ncbi:hypothetical protein [Nannocystis pusilla]|uniref:hypothetical protein n=1 Tax=Nannocystis pusilla TaxID=889268 RepID=UPI003B82BC0F
MPRPRPRRSATARSSASAARPTSSACATRRASTTSTSSSRATTSSTSSSASAAATSRSPSPTATATPTPRSPPPPSGFDTNPAPSENSAPVETRPLTASEKAGILGDIAVRYREAIGYSNKLSFDEAFADALKKLPPPSVKFPDMLETVEVVQIGASFGGIAGFRRLEVRIRAYPD